MSFKDNFTILPRGFLVNTNEPIDARFSVPNSESRLNIATVANPEGEGFVSTQLYNGLIMFQKDTEELFLLLDKDNAGLESSWKLLYPTSGSTSDTGSLITASVAGNVIEFEKANGDLFTITVDTGSGGNAFPFTGSALITGSLVITGSLDTTGSVKLALDTSSTAVDKVMMYDDTTGQVFITSSAAIGGSSVTFVGTASNVPGTISQTIQSIKTLDFNPNDALVQFNTSNGELTFIFGDPPSPEVGVNTSGYDANNFNLETQSFSVTGTYNVFSNGFISASLKETTPDNLTLEHTDINVGSLTRIFNDRTGSKAALGQPEYRFTMELTSSSPIDGSLDKRIDATTLTLNKSLPIGPSINTNIDEISNFGGQSQKYSNTVIEAGATGSISYTSSKGGNDQNWRFIEMENSQNPGITLVPILPTGPGNSSISGSIDIGSFAIDQVFNFKSSASYDSDNGPGATPSAKGTPLNDPYRFEYRPSSTKTINRARSLRAASFLSSDTASVIANLGDIDLFTKKGINFHEYVAPPLPAPQQDNGATLGPFDMFHYGGVNGNPNNKEISFCGPNDFVQMIVISKTLPNGNPTNYNITITEKATGIDATNTFSQTGDQGDYKYYINPTPNNELPFRGTLDPLTYIITT